MTNLLTYLLQVSIVFTCFNLLYYFFFRNLTFHSINRIVLLLIMPLSLALPHLNLSSTPIMVDYTLPGLEFDSVFTQYAMNHVSSESDKNTTDHIHYFTVIYFVGVGVALSLFLLAILRMVHIKRLAKQAANYKNVYFSGNTTSPFSFLKWVFLPKGLKFEHQEPIVQHELTHIEHLHTLDLLSLEIYTVFLWFNPFTLLYRQLLKSVHEYQVDASITKSHTATADYLHLLLENLSPTNGNYLSSNFNHFSIKNRIFMLTKNKSKHIQSIRYLLFLPIITFLLMSFASTTGTEPSIFPIKEGLYDRISSPYGVHKKDPITKKVLLHHGIDIVAKTGTPVLATGSGKVIKAEQNRAYGNMIIIDHGSNIHTLYAHLHKINIELGDQVTIRDIIGEVGTTGKSISPHLHYEVRKDGKVVDPNAYFNK